MIAVADPAVLNAVEAVASRSTQPIGNPDGLNKVPAFTTAPKVAASAENVPKIVPSSIKVNAHLRKKPVVEEGKVMVNVAPVVAAVWKLIVDATTVGIVVEIGATLLPAKLPKTVSEGLKFNFASGVAVAKIRIGESKESSILSMIVSSEVREAVLITGSAPS
jgi:hypothetical protein